MVVSVPAGGGGAEQDRIDGSLVLEGDLARQRRQLEDDAEVGHRQQFGLSMREPFGARQPLALREWRLRQEL